MANRVHINNLQIKLPRSAAGQAQNIAARLGRDILRSLGESACGRSGNIRIEEVSAGKMRSVDMAGVGGKVAEKVIGNAALRH